MDFPSVTPSVLKIGVIGPRDSIEKIDSVVRDNYPHVQLKAYEKIEVSEEAEVFDLCQEENDGNFFRG